MKDRIGVKSGIYSENNIHKHNSEKCQTEKRINIVIIYIPMN